MADNPLFDQFWNLWPGNGSQGFEEYTRKKDRLKCEQKWKNFKLDSQSTAILHDVKTRKQFDKGWRQSAGRFLCAPLVYLNGKRWLDGDFADIRHQKQQKSPQRPLYQDLPQLSQWEIASNTVMWKASYGKRLEPLGPERLQQMLQTKRKIVQEAEQSEANGNPWLKEEFVDILQNALEPTQ